MKFFIIFLITYVLSQSAFSCGPSTILPQYTAQAITISNGIATKPHTDENRQVLSGCKTVDGKSYFARVYFQANNYVSNGPNFKISPAGLSFQMKSGAPSYSSDKLDRVKQYISNHLTLTLAFKPNVTPSSEVVLQNTSKINLLPEYTLSNQFTKSSHATYNEDAGLKYYAGAGGWETVGVYISSQTIFTFGTNSPTSEISEIFNNINTIILDIGNYTFDIVEGTLSGSTFSPTSVIDKSKVSTSVTLSLTPTFTRATCAIIVPSTLNLGATTQSYINEHSFARTADVPVNIACSNTIEARNIRVTVNDINTNNNDGILSNIADSATRSNAVIRLKHNDNTPIKLGEAFLFTPVMEGSGYKNWNGSVKAEIFRPSDISNVTLGLVQGQATFTMTYD
jgi:type 1 fimbria pilin